MDALKEISDILAACGCAPAIINTVNGAAVKINAPNVNKKEDTKK